MVWRYGFDPFIKAKKRKPLSDGEYSKLYVLQKMSDSYEICSSLTSPSLISPHARLRTRKTHLRQHKILPFAMASVCNSHTCMYARINIPAPWGCSYHPGDESIELRSSLLAIFSNKTRMASGERYAHRERGPLQLATQFVRDASLIADSKERLTAVLVEGRYVSFIITFSRPSDSSNLM